MMVSITPPARGSCAQAEAADIEAAAMASVKAFFIVFPVLIGLLIGNTAPESRVIKALGSFVHVALILTVCRAH